MITHIKILTLLMIGIILVGSAWASRYRQPAYVTNAYFTNELIKANGVHQPDQVINVIRAHHTSTRGFFVLDIITEQGSHLLSLDILDKNGKKFDQQDFPPVDAERNDFSISLNLTYGGKLPEGGIFFKLYDVYNNGKRQGIGTFRITSEAWD